MPELLTTLSQEIGAYLLERGWQITCAESCTGGTLMAAITESPGSSAYFGCGFVTYSHHFKQSLLGVKSHTLTQWGSVSVAVAEEMAQGAQRLTHAHIAIAVTGIAGPSAHETNKPVGTVCFAWVSAEGLSLSQQHLFQGDRAAIRQQATFYALLVLRDKFLTVT